MNTFILIFANLILLTSSLAHADETRSEIALSIGRTFHWDAPRGEPVSISAVGEKEIYKIRICDNGSKIKASKLNTYSSFKQFNRDKYEQQGLGAGLALSKCIVNFYEGNISFSDNTPVGILVIITFKI